MKNFDRFYKDLLGDTKKSQEDLKTVTNALVKDERFVLLGDYNNELSKLSTVLWRGVEIQKGVEYGLINGYGMLIVVQLTSPPVFVTDTYAVGSFYKKDKVNRLVPYFGVGKSKSLLEISKILHKEGIEFEVDEDNEPMSGPWVWNTSDEKKIELGIPKEVLKLSPKMRYSISIAGELVPVIQEDLIKKNKDEEEIDLFFKNVDWDNVPKC